MPAFDRRTKIVATIGPASSSEEMLFRLIEAGMDAARLNFSHGTHDDHIASAKLVREAQQAITRPLAIVADLQGPKLRIGDLPAPVELEVGETVVVSGGDSARADDLPVAPAVLGSVLETGSDVLIDDGHVRLRVERVENGRATCRVLTGGIVEPHKGVNVPGIPLPVPSLTEKDLADLECALELGVDYVAQSFVRSRADVAALRAKIEASGSQAWVIAKIELKEAVSALDDILDEADAVMIARGDLGVEVGAGRGSAAPEAHHPRRPRAGQAGDHGDADARDDGAPAGADARGGLRRRERDPRRHVRGHALRRDGHRRVPGRGRRDDGDDRAGGRAEPRLPPPAARRPPTHRPSAARCRMRPATSRRRSPQRRSSCRPSPAARLLRSRDSGRGGRSSH